MLSRAGAACRYLFRALASLSKRKRDHPEDEPVSHLDPEFGRNRKRARIQSGSEGNTEERDLDRANTNSESVPEIDQGDVPATPEAPSTAVGLEEYPAMINNATFEGETPSDGSIRRTTPMRSLGRLTDLKDVAEKREAENSEAREELTNSGTDEGGGDVEGNGAVQDSVVVESLSGDQERGENSEQATGGGVQSEQSVEEVNGGQASNGGNVEVETKDRDEAAREGQVDAQEETDAPSRSPSFSFDAGDQPPVEDSEKSIEQLDVGIASGMKPGQGTSEEGNRMTGPPVRNETGNDPGNGSKDLSPLVLEQPVHPVARVVPPASSPVTPPGLQNTPVQNPQGPGGPVGDKERRELSWNALFGPQPKPGPQVREGWHFAKESDGIWRMQNPSAPARKEVHPAHATPPVRHRQPQNTAPGVQDAFSTYQKDALNSVECSAVKYKAARGRLVDKATTTFQEHSKQTSPGDTDPKPYSPAPQLQFPSPYPELPTSRSQHVPLRSPPGLSTVPDPSVPDGPLFTGERAWVEANRNLMGQVVPFQDHRDEYGRPRHGELLDREFDRACYNYPYSRDENFEAKKVEAGRGWVTDDWVGRSNRRKERNREELRELEAGRQPEDLLHLSEEDTVSYAGLPGDDWLNDEVGSVPIRPVRQVSKEDLAKYMEVLSAPRHIQAMELKGFDFEVAKLQCLAEGEWLNDEVMNGYMKMLQERDGRWRDTKSDYPKVHFCKSFFMSKLLENGYNYDGVKKWTKPIRLKNWGQKSNTILDCNQIVIPVHLTNHWVLVVADLDNSQLAYYDSLKGYRGAIIEAVGQYITDEARDKKGEHWNVHNWEVVAPKEIPEQLNGCDCGVFALQYARHIAGDAPLDFTQDDMFYFRVEMMMQFLAQKVE